MVNITGPTRMDVPDPIVQYKDSVLRALRSATAVQVFDGEVPDVVETDEAGYIRPYVVLFASDGDDLGETDLSGMIDMDGLRWDFQTTSVGASADVAFRVGTVVRKALTNLPLGTYHVLPSPMSYPVPPTRDTTVSPVRFFLPRQWRLDTT